MSHKNPTCHGQHNCLLAASESAATTPLRKAVWRSKTFVWHCLWHLQTEGFRQTVLLALAKFAAVLPGVETVQTAQKKKTFSAEPQSLHLQPGELVEVKSEQEILATLDENRKLRGLPWMPAMRRFCGKRYRVHKRLETILLESTGEIRKVKNTVLLENVTCDGSDFYGCDRSCFHYWREAWLKRVTPDLSNSPQ